MLYAACNAGISFMQDGQVDDQKLIITGPPRRLESVTDLPSVVFKVKSGAILPTTVPTSTTGLGVTGVVWVGLIEGVALTTGLVTGGNEETGADETVGVGVAEEAAGEETVGVGEGVHAASSRIKSKIIG